jgi:hypothetical protein
MSLLHLSLAGIEIELLMLDSHLLGDARLTLPSSLDRARITSWKTRIFSQPQYGDFFRRGT